jgi:hypothetical protein
MQRPTVLLILSEASPYVEALRAGGFDPIAGMEAAVERMADGARVDLAVIDCDGSPELVSHAFGLTHGEAPIPSLLLFDDEPPSFMLEADNSAHDELVRGPISADALVFRLQAMLLRAGRALPADSGGLVHDDRRRHRSTRRRGRAGPRRRCPPR